MLYQKVICVWTLALIAATDPTSKANDTLPPCEQICSMQWGPEWTKCAEVQECKSYVEMQYRHCVTDCEKERQ